VIDAQREGRPAGPREASMPPRPTAATEACEAGQSSIAARARTPRDTTAVPRALISSGSPYERTVGFSRAVVVGDRVFVAGTAPVMPDDAEPPPDSYGQTKRCLDIIGAALGEAGGSLADVVRTRAYLVETGAFDGFARAHGEAFSEVRPANTTVVVKALLDPRWLVEIEAEAVIAP